MSPLKDLFQNMTPGEIKYAIKIITGDLRIGLKESLVEEAIAKAFDRPLAAVRRANMLTGDIAETLSFAAADNLMSVQIRLFHPIGFMLATPVETANATLPGYLSLNDVASEGRGAVLVEEKYDGIRAQVHKSAAGVKVFSRTLDEITEFPELQLSLCKASGRFHFGRRNSGLEWFRPSAIYRAAKTLGQKTIGLIPAARNTGPLRRLRPYLPGWGAAA